MPASAAVRAISAVSPRIPAHGLLTEYMLAGPRRGPDHVQVQAVRRGDVDHGYIGVVHHFPPIRRHARETQVVPGLLAPGRPRRRRRGPARVSARCRGTAAGPGGRPRPCTAPIHPMPMMPMPIFEAMTFAPGSTVDAIAPCRPRDCRLQPRDRPFSAFAISYISRLIAPGQPKVSIS